MMMGGGGKAPPNTWAKSGLKLSGTRDWDGLGGRRRRGSLPLRGRGLLLPPFRGGGARQPPAPRPGSPPTSLKPGPGTGC